MNSRLVPADLPEHTTLRADHLARLLVELPATPPAVFEVDSTILPPVLAVATRVGYVDDVAHVCCEMGIDGFVRLRREEGRETKRSAQTRALYLARESTLEVFIVLLMLWTLRLRRSWVMFRVSPYPGQGLFFVSCTIALCSHGLNMLCSDE